MQPMIYNKLLIVKELDKDSHPKNYVKSLIDNLHYLLTEVYKFIVNKNQLLLNLLGYYFSAL